ncbi:hypothetical protein CXG81DRAFT_17856 [Caulochytrium protostelioides]|uniref:Autophagy protein 5 n=1 Tax=Caulochytrium protostelioides TaxID=1555241 RepID=A0A4P9XAT6_9FUNG|nr:hypothetical protein CXG81DRAFT_17856 [Caulochytrium protostelioides]|eukprot:RKP02494.1 hypothetical protein CXG81DRAFT_17856 [Caulochytrium protostelioides]
MATAVDRAASAHAAAGADVAVDVQEHVWNGKILCQFKLAPEARSTITASAASPAPRSSPASRLASGFSQSHLPQDEADHDVSTGHADVSVATASSADIPFYLFVRRSTYMPLVMNEILQCLAPHLIRPQHADARARCWLEDDAGPIRWHLPIGLLHDLRVARLAASNRHATPSASSASALMAPWHDVMPGGGAVDPWTVIVHTDGMPMDQIMPLLGTPSSSVASSPAPSGSQAAPATPGAAAAATSTSAASSTAVATATGNADLLLDHYVSLLKQADFIRHGSIKRTMALSKDDQTTLWNAVQLGRFGAYQRIVRLLADAPPPPPRAADAATERTESPRRSSPDHPTPPGPTPAPSTNTSPAATEPPRAVPLRVYVALGAKDPVAVLQGAFPTDNRPLLALLNHAPVAEVGEKLRHVGGKDAPLARQIVAARPFRGPRDLLRIRALTPDQADRLWWDNLGVHPAAAPVDLAGHPESGAAAADAADGPDALDAASATPPPPRTLYECVWSLMREHAQLATPLRDAFGDESETFGSDDDDDDDDSAQDSNDDGLPADDGLGGAADLQPRDDEEEALVLRFGYRALCQGVWVPLQSPLWSLAHELAAPDTFLHVVLVPCTRRTR